MSPRYANRKDSVHEDIVTGLERHGIVCFDMPQPGDVLTWNPFKEFWLPIEFKSDAKTRGYKPELTKAQTARAARGVRIPIAHNLDEALRLHGIILV